MKVLKAIVRFLNKIVDLSFLLVCLIMFLIGLYALYDSYLVYQDASDHSLQKFKPGHEQEEEEREIKGNMVAWLTVHGTSIDYPVMQGETNSEFLNKNPYGDYSLSGSIFLDSRNSPDFTDPYSLIYGHHMEHGMMFGAIDRFLDEEFFRTHHTGALIVGDTTYALEFFAIVEAEATDDAIFFPTEHDDLTLPFVWQHALYKSDHYWPLDRECIVALSTCKYPDTADRTILFAAIRIPGIDFVYEEEEPDKD